MYVKSLCASLYSTLKAVSQLRTFICSNIDPLARHVAHISGWI